MFILIKGCCIGADRWANPLFVTANRAIAQAYVDENEADLDPDEWLAIQEIEVK